MTPHPLCAWCARRHDAGPERCMWGWAVVCGGRDYADRDALFHALDRLCERIELLGIRHGGATGADALAGLWAREKGIPEDAQPADWRAHGKAAGPRRNAAMLTTAPRPVCVVAMRGGAGTADLVRQAEAAGLPVWRVGSRSP